MTASALRDRLPASLPLIPAVRPQVISKDRKIVDTTGDVWRFRASDDGGRLLHINWPVIAAASAPMVLSERAIQIIKLHVTPLGALRARLQSVALSKDAQLHQGLR